MKTTILQGDCLETLKTLDAESVQCVVTSPPYYGLRDYGVEGQIGLEETPEAYVEKLVAVFREVRRVLKDDGVLWVNLGDSYWGGKGSNANLDTHIDDRIKEGRTLQRPQTRIGGMRVIPTNGKHPEIKPKDLVGIPWMVAFALRADGWYLRSEVIWNKPNPMPESVEDRPTKSHEQIFLLSKQPVYYYDGGAIAEPSIDPESYAGRRKRNAPRMAKFDKKNLKNAGSILPDGTLTHGQIYETRNKRSVWTVTTKPYKEAHFATFPPDLIEPCILAGSKEGDTVLDPFNGSGTTGAVSVKWHRNYIGCELNPAYIRLTNKRLGMVQPVLFV